MTGYSSFYVAFVFLLFGFNLIKLSNSKIVLSAQQKNTVGQFREAVKGIITHDYQTSDGYLYLWLKAAAFDVNAAVDKFKTAQQWRKENKIDTIGSESFPDLKLAFPFSSDGVDYEGRTVLTGSSGNFDLRKVVLSGNGDRFLRFWLSEMEQAVRKGAEAVYKSNGTITDPRLVAITDLQGFSLRKHACLACIQFQAQALRLLIKYYPGVTATFIHINTPRIAKPMYDVLTNVLPPAAKDIYKFFGHDRAEWSDYILKIVPADQLTYQYGGTKQAL